MDSSVTYKELAGALRTRIAVIGDREFYERDPAGHLEKLKEASAQIESAGRALPRPVPGDLAHYLQGCSYQKALSWLESRGYG